MCLSLITGYQSACGSLGFILCRATLVSITWLSEANLQEQQKYTDVCNFAHFCKYRKCIKTSDRLKGKKRREKKNMFVNIKDKKTEKLGHKKKVRRQEAFFTPGFAGTVNHITQRRGLGDPCPPPFKSHLPQ